MVWLTPDHPVLTPNGRWCPADILAPAPVNQPVDAFFNLAFNLVVGLDRGVLLFPAGGGEEPVEEALVCCTLGQAVPGMPDPVWGARVILYWYWAQLGWPNIAAPIPHLRPPSSSAAPSTIAAGLVPLAPVSGGQVGVGLAEVPAAYESIGRLPSAVSAPAVAALGLRQRLPRAASQQPSAAMTDTLTCCPVRQLQRPRWPWAVVHCFGTLGHTCHRPVRPNS